MIISWLVPLYFSFITFSRYLKILALHPLFTTLCRKSLQAKLEGFESPRKPILKTSKGTLEYHQSSSFDLKRSSVVKTAIEI